MSRERGLSSLVTLSSLQMVIAAFAIFFAAADAGAQSSGPYFYPTKGQIQEEQDKDKYECNQWAISQSGFDPGRSQPTTSTNVRRPRGQAARGAGRGAALGAVGGAVAGDAGTGAAAGAAIGGAAGAIRRRAAKKEVREQQAKGQAAALSGQEAYNRALAACMQGRGYVVK